ncbi:MAG: alpha/beta fold hydrolase [Myxococcales bacterium]|nr:alpha/beta fold hydrolase [Myxococcales bacterium]
MSILEFGDIVLGYSETGSGDPVVLLHGQGGRGDAWDLQAAALSREYRVVCPDLRGHGQSSVTPRPYTMALLAADVAGLIRGLGLGACHVVGHSLGGMVALQLALDCPELVRSLALVNSAAFGDGSRVRSFVVRTFIRLAGMRRFARANAGMHLPDPEQAPLRSRLIAVMGACSPIGYAAAQDAVDGFDARGRLAEVACPVLVVHSEHDLIALADKQTIVAGVRRGRLEIVEDSRHLVVWDQAARLNACLLGFLAEGA